VISNGVLCCASTCAEQGLDQNMAGTLVKWSLRASHSGGRGNSGPLNRAGAR
jgi:hypothetical protein